MSREFTSSTLVGSAVVFGIVLMLVVVMMLATGVVISSLDFFGASSQVDPRPAGTFTTVDDRPDVPGRVSVSATTETALYFDGTDYVESDAHDTLTGSPWTVCAAAELDSDANLANTYDVAAVENESIMLQYDAGSWLAYYNNSTADGKATIDAPSPHGMTFVCGRWNGTQLQIYRNGTAGSPSTLSATTTSRNVSTEWYGRLDEVRVYNSSLTASQVQSYADHPILPVQGVTPDGRYMFDEGSGGTTHVYFADTTANVVGASWVDGLRDESYTRGVEYELRGEPFSIKVIQGSRLDGAPVLYVEYASAAYVGLLGDVVTIGGAGFVIFLVTLLFVPVVGLLVYIRQSSLSSVFDTSLKR